MKKTMRFLLTVLLMAGAVLQAEAADYTTFLTTERGFTEVTTPEAILGDASYCYVLASAEDVNLIVGIGRYEAKPDWASTDTKALRYRSAAIDPVLDLSNFFTIEKNGSFIGFRNLIYSSDLFQTHDNAGYMYVNTFTDKTLDEWSYLTPTYQNGYWLFESGKYPVSSGNWACGYLGPWNNQVKVDEPIALNRRNTSGDEAGHYRLFRILKKDLFLNAGRGFTEVTTTNDIQTGANHCYLIVSAENSNLIVGVGPYEEKPEWAGENTKALRYRSTVSDPALNLSNFFTIEKSGSHIGLRNMVYDTDLFQTHDNMGFVYVNTFTEKTLDEWSYLIPTYQNGYWLFESGKYPISSGNWACGYLGPWNKRVAEGEPLALNRRNTNDDAAGHYRLLHISRSDLMALRQQLYTTNELALADMTSLIANPSFETGDETGWALIGKEDGNNEFKTRDYGMTGRDGSYLMNAFQWWASSLGIKQTVTEIPAGVYELSATVASWEGRTVTLNANNAKASAIGINDGTGVPISLTVTIDDKQQMTIHAASTTDWWTEGVEHPENDIKCFFKTDDFRLKCKGFFLSALSAQLPNDRTTLLQPNQWYYYDIPYHSEYQFIGQIADMVYSTDGAVELSAVNTNPVQRQMMVKGRIFVKTSRSDATLNIVPLRSMQQGTLKAVALNVDGLPNKIATIDLNPDGPGSDGTKKISQYLASKNYDIIGCSEDFNYHSELMSWLNDNYNSTTVRATLGLADIDYLKLIQGKVRFDTDGLNLIWKKNGKTNATNESWTKWNDTEDTDGNQYVKKGFRHYDLQIDGGPSICVYILHMDAGDTNATWSRESQWRQLADDLNQSGHNTNRTKLIIGDTNSRWTREDIITNFVNRLSSDYTMSDVWVELWRDGIYPTVDMNNITDQSDKWNFSNYEVVDKIIYINPKAANTVQLRPLSYKLEQDYTYGTIDGDGNTKHLGDHEPLVVEFAYQQSGDLNPLVVSLQDNADNSSQLTTINGALTSVTIDGRTLYKDNTWNTLCLPFDMTAEQVAAQLAPAALMELDTEGTYSGHKTGMDGGVLYLYFKNATAITAGKPYIVKWTNGSNLVNPVFGGVTVSNGSPAGVQSADNAVTFQGTYAPAALVKDDPTNLYLGADKKLYWPSVDNFKVNAFRAYFRLNGAAPSRIVMIIGDDETTGIGSLTSTPSPISERSIYTLSGQKLRVGTSNRSPLTSPLKKGVYILRSADGKNDRKVLK